MITSSVRAHNGEVIFFSSQDDLFRYRPYRFDKGLCGDPLAGMAHAFATLVAITNGWPYSMIPNAPTAAERAASERMAESYAPRFRYSD